MVDYWNNTSQAERKRLIAEAAKPTTYRDQARVTDPELGGRFGANVVAGEAPFVPYPKQDPNSPWSNAAELPP